MLNIGYNKIGSIGADSIHTSLGFIITLESLNLNLYGNYVGNNGAATLF